MYIHNIYVEYFNTYCQYIMTFLLYTECNLLNCITLYNICRYIKKKDLMWCKFLNSSRIIKIILRLIPIKSDSIFEKCLLIKPSDKTKNSGTKVRSRLRRLHANGSRRDTPLASPKSPFTTNEEFPHKSARQLVIQKRFTLTRPASYIVSDP